jgi:hypothetical protein
MSENEPAPGPMPENETVNELPTAEIKDKPVDWDSLKVGARTVAAISVLALGVTYGAELYFGGDDSKGNTVPVASAQHPRVEQTKRATPGKKECREVSGVLRIVGVSAEQVQTVNGQDEVGEIPHMYHQRDDDGKKADVKFEWRVDSNKLAPGEDAAFYTAVRYHFRPFTERSDAPMLNAKDTVIPDNAFNLDGAVGEIVQIGHMQVCETK